MNSKIIIIATLILVLVSITTLFAVEKKANDYDYAKNWTAVYFENADNNSLDFYIENHQGAEKQYKYEIFLGDKSIAASEISSSSGSRQKISPVIGTGEIAENKRFSVEVSLGDVKYKIYKDFK